MSTNSLVTTNRYIASISGCTANSTFAAEGILPRQSAQQKNTAALIDFVRQNGSDFINWYKHLIEANGTTVSTRKVSIAHEVGHTVVALSLGAITTEIDLFRDRRGQWCGWTEFCWPSSIERREVSVLGNPRDTTRSVLLTIAGFCGEEVIGLGHPSSSPDEIYRVAQVCATVAHAKGVNADDLMNSLMVDARERIYINRPLFEAIAQLLNVTNKLSASTIRRLAKKHGVVKVPIKPAW